MKTINIFGATGYVGENIIAALENYKDQFIVNAVVGNNNIEKLASIAIKANAKYAYTSNAGKFEALADMLSQHSTKVCIDIDQLFEEKVDISIIAISTISSLKVAIKAAACSDMLAIASKESIVCGLRFIQEINSNIIPLDSEHNAIYQIIESRPNNISSVMLTASGGPFLNADIPTMQKATVKEVANHPIWKMGLEISICSANMANKGIEVIEASKLFNVKAKDISVVVHPQSIIHGGVYYRDGTCILNTYHPTMQIPIMHALQIPNNTNIKHLDMGRIGNLELRKPDYDKFPMLRIAFDICDEDEKYHIAFNAVIELCTDLFIAGKIGFLDIHRYVEIFLQNIDDAKITNCDEILIYDMQCKQKAMRIIRQHTTIKM